MKTISTSRTGLRAGFAHKLPFIVMMMLLMFSLSACGGAAEGSADAGDSSGSSEEEYSTTVYAMDTPINLTAWGDQAKTAVEEAAAEIQRIDNLLSVTSEDSQIGQLNARTANVISGETLDVVRDSIRMSELTGGSFNITVYPIVRAWGFTTGGEYRVPSDEEITELLSHVGMGKFSLTAKGDDAAEVTFSDDQTMLDTGAITKGYASDRVYEIFESYGIDSALASLGGNVITKGVKIDGNQWKVGVTDPFNPDDYCIAVAVADKFLVTSGGYERYFTADDGTRYIHIMDPSTGRPVDNDLESVTIISDNGSEADALSTALFVRGVDGAIDFWKTCGDLDFEMILIDENSVIYVTVGVAGSCTVTGSYLMQTIEK